MATTVDNLVLQYTTRGEAGLRRSLRATGGDVGTLENRFNMLGLAANAAAAFGGYKLVGFIKTAGVESLKAAGNIEQTEKAFGRLLGSSQAGVSKVNESLKFARNSPLDLTTVVSGEQKLLAMGFAADELIPTMKTLGDAMSTLNGGDEMFQRVLYNLGQVRQQGKAYGMDIRQFAMAGISASEMVKLATGKSLTQHELTEMDGEDFIKAFMKGMNIKFGGMMDQIMNTLPGRVHKLQNSFLALKIDTGKMISNDASVFLDKLTGVVDKFDSLIKNHPNVAKGLLGGAAVTAGGAGALLLGGALAGSYNNLSSVLGRTAKAKGLLTAATKLDSAAESAKAIVAGKEGKAIGAVGNIANSVTGSKLKLAGAAEKEGLAAEKAAGKLGLLGKAEKLAGNQVVSAVEVVGAEKAAGKLGLLGKGITKEIEVTGANAANGVINGLARNQSSQIGLSVVGAESAAKKLSIFEKAKQMTGAAPMNAYALPSFNTEPEVAAIERITKAQKARIGVSKDLSRAMVDLDKKRALANAAAMLDGTYETRLAAESEKVAKALNLQGEAGLKAANNLAKQNLASQGITEASSFASPKTIKATEDLAKAEARVAKARQARNALNIVEGSAGAELEAARKLAAAEVVLAEQTAARTSSIWVKAGRLVGGAGRSITGAAGRVGGYLSEPAFNIAEKAGPALKSGAYVDPMAFYTTRGGKLAVRSQLYPAGPANAGKLALAESEGAGGLRNTLGGISNARLLGGAAMGAGVGVQSYGDWKAAGYTTGQAAAAATTTGIGAGLLTMFVPGGAIAIAAGEAIGWGVNKFYNEKLEKQAQGSISDKEMAAAGKMSPAQLAQFYFKKRDEALARGDSTEAQSYLYNANQQQRKAKKQAEAADVAARDAARAKSNAEDAAYNKINSIRGAFSNPVVDKSRNDAWTIKIPGSPADKSHRTMKYNANTPAPAYL